MVFRHPGQRYEVDAFEPCNLGHDEIEAYVAEVRRVFSFEPGDKAEELVERLGGRLHYEDTLRFMDEGTLFVHGRRDFDIILPRFTGPLRDQMTMAHELGHYFLHSRQGELPLIARRDGDGRHEREADWFAAALLMPAEPFRRSVVQRAGDLGLVALDFRVSRDAAAVRYEVLGSP